MAKHGNSARQGGLGRGLGALIVNTDAAATNSAPAASAQANANTNPSIAEPMQAETNGIREVAVEAISPNPHQPRSLFDTDALNELATSISEHGIIQPLIVTLPDTPKANVPKADAPKADGESATEKAYWLVAGERRWRAAQIAGLATVPVIVREASTRQLMEWALVENIQRADLNALEEAAAYQAMIDELSLTQIEVADRVGKSRSAIANTLRLQQLPSEAQNALVTGQISAGHARTLLGLSDKKMMLAALETILAQDLSVRQAEVLIKKLLDAPDEELIQPDDETEQMSVHLAHLEDRFRLALNTRVSLNRQNDGSGKLVIHFYNDDDLDSIYQQIAGSEDAI